jgi:protein-disulfide isomerase
VTIVEFSDFQCPFCKAYFDQTYPSRPQEAHMEASRSRTAAA